jgi:D-serine dehydratase
MGNMTLEEKEIEKWIVKYPLLNKIIDLEPVVWFNPNLKRMKQISSLPVTKLDMEDAARLWERFAPFLANEFPETSVTSGIIESPLRKIANMKNELNSQYNAKLVGELYLKCDNELPIAGSIKARGGVYEVLHYAEKLAIEAGLLKIGDDYTAFSNDDFKAFFSQFSIGVGSTGNLGLSIGIIGAKLGFQVRVYMSSDAKQWKKDLLREKGASVMEFNGDFSEAILAGRLETTKNPNAYFVDDEDSKYLFLGYSVAAIRLQKQLEEENIIVDADHPLFVYQPCGVGGSPGGVAFGLKQIFGDNVHCFFVEPTHSPAVLIGLLTGEREKVCVQDFGIDNRTEGDGLAVGRPSRFASIISDKLISGIYTMEDNELFTLLATLADSEGIYVEPSAASGLIGPGKIKATTYALQDNLDPQKTTHIVWATGGALVPKEDMKGFYEKGKRLK